MPVTKRTKEQREADAEVIAKLSRRGYGTKMIAAEIAKIRDYTISYVQVSLDLKKIRAEWSKNALRDMDAIKQQELQGLEDQERELWAAWEKSKSPEEKQKQRVRTGGAGAGAGQLAERSTEKTEQCGDPAYMRLILDIREKRAKILGLNAPEKAELSGPDGGPIRVENEYDDEHLAQWAAERYRPREASAAGIEAGADRPM